MGWKTSSGPGDSAALQSWLWQKAARAMNAPDSDLSERRQELLDAYLGQPYGDEEEGFSRVVTREVLEAVEWTMPSLARVFCSGTSPVAFKPVGTSREEARLDIKRARQEEAYICHRLDLTENWYESRMQWMRAALIQVPASYAKLWWHVTLEGQTETYEGITEIQVGMYDQDPNTEIVGVESYVEERMTPQGPMAVELFNVQARHAYRTGRMKFAPVPPEEVLVDNDLSFINLDEAEWVCHHRRVPRSELIGMGYDRDMVESLPTAENLEHSSERENRARFHDEDPHYSDDYGSMEKVDLYESYGLYDFDDDGIAEYRKMVFAGGSGKDGSAILENVETDYQPLLALSCTPQPYRHVGLPLAEQIEDVQRVNSVLSRQANNNLYRTNQPRQFFDESRVNVEQILNYTPFGGVETEGDPRSVVMPEQIPVVIDQVLKMVEYWKNEGVARTGVSRHTQGLDADVLAKSTMGAFMGAIGQASMREELIVRDMAETGYTQLYRKAHQLVRKHQNVFDVFEMSGEWLDVNPSEWRERKHVTVKVGAGTGSQHERIGSSMALLDVQREALPQGMTTKGRIYNTLDRLCGAMGVSDTNLAFVDPDSDEGQQIAAQMEQARQQEMQMQAGAMSEPLRIQAEQQDKDRIVDIMKLREQQEKRADESERWRTELEAKENVDVPGSAV